MSLVLCDTSVWILTCQFWSSDCRTVFIIPLTDRFKLTSRSSIACLWCSSAAKRDVYGSICALFSSRSSSIDVAQLCWINACSQCYTAISLKPLILHYDNHYKLGLWENMLTKNSCLQWVIFILSGLEMYHELNIYNTVWLLDLMTDFYNDLQLL